jgi:hypothetical protein
MSQAEHDDYDPAADPAWVGAARFLEGRVPGGMRVVAPGSFAGVVGPLAPPRWTALPDWAVVNKGRLEEFQPALLRLLLAQATPVYANEAYVVFARRPTFGLTDQSNSAHVQSLVERVATLGSGPSISPSGTPAPTMIEASIPKANRPPEVGLMPLAHPQAPDTPRGAVLPEALARAASPSTAAPAPALPSSTPPPARDRTAPTPAAPPPRLEQPAPADAGSGALPRAVAPVPARGEALAPPRREDPAQPSVQEPNIPPAPSAPSRPGASASITMHGTAPAQGSGAASSHWGGLPARVAALLGDGAGRRVVEFGRGGLAAASLAASAMVSDGANGLPDDCFDLALLLPDDIASLEHGTAEAARLLQAGGLALVVAENAGSLGRRLAAALGRHPTGGLAAAEIRDTLRAAGLVPLRLEGFSLDAWRASADAPPSGLAASDPAATWLEAAGRDAGPEHAAKLLFLARRP